jgi:type 1 glutamine amidotransferase
MHAKAVFFTGLGRIPVWSFAVVVQLRLSFLKCTNSSDFARACIGLLIWLLACACSGPSSQSESDVPASQSESDKPVFTVLVFTKTAEFRHESIPAGIRAIQSLGDEQHFRVDSSEDSAVFTDANLARYQVIVFLNTTGDILDLNQQAAFERFIQRGGGFAGIHSATDTEYDWGWYGRLVGVYFDNHPPIQIATVKIVDATHLSTIQLPATWTRNDEWYNFRADPSPHVSVLIQVDEMTYMGGTMGTNHPISWYHEFDGGRAWYTAMGHTTESYSDPLFLRHLSGGIRWAAGVPRE